MDNAVTQSAPGALRREINLLPLIAIMIGLNIGGSLFLLTGIAAGLTGPSLIVAQVVSALPILLALPAYLTLTSAMPVTCANYQYAKLFSRPLAVAAWMVLFIAIPLGSLPLFAIATGQLLAVLVPGVPVTAIAIIVMTLFYVINVLGIKPTAYVQLAAVAVLLIALVTFVGPGLTAIKAQNLSPLFTGGAIGFVGASALLYTLLAGGLFGIEMGGETRDAESVIPKALVISIGVVLGAYLLIELVAVGVADWTVLAAGTLGEPARVFLSGPPLAFFITGGGVLASITTINLSLTAGGRYTLAFAHDGFFPGVFGRVNKRFGTPHAGLTLMYLMSVVTILINPPIRTLGAILNFGLLFMVTLVLLAAFRLPRNHPELCERARVRFRPGFLKAASLSAVCLNVVFMVILAAALKWTFLYFVAAALVGVALYFIRKRAMAAGPPGAPPDGIAG